MLTFGLFFILCFIELSAGNGFWINISNCTLHIAKFFIGFDFLFLANFCRFLNETAGLCINNSINKDAK